MDLGSCGGYLVHSVSGFALGGFQAMSAHYFRNGQGIAWHSPLLSGAGKLPRAEHAGASRYRTPNARPLAHPPCLGRRPAQADGMAMRLDPAMAEDAIRRHTPPSRVVTPVQTGDAVGHGVPAIALSGTAHGSSMLVPPHKGGRILCPGSWTRNRTLPRGLGIGWRGQTIPRALRQTETLW